MFSLKFTFDLLNDFHLEHVIFFSFSFEIMRKCRKQHLQSSNSGNITLTSGTGGVSGATAQALEGSRGLYSESHKLSFLVSCTSNPGQSSPRLQIYIINALMIRICRSNCRETDHLCYM